MAECKEHWCHVVGKLQRLVPVYVAQHYCEQKKFYANKEFRNTILSRSLHLLNWTADCEDNFGCWFPLSSDSGLGFDFAIYNSGQGASWGVGIGGSSLSCIANLLALTRLREERMQDVKELRETLSTPLQQHDLDTSHGMSL